MTTDPRDLPVHFSALKMIDLSPAHYRHAATKSWGGGTLAQRMGTAAHAATFEPARLVEFTGKVRRGKEWEAFQADHPHDAVIVNAREYAYARAIAAALREHPIAAPILFGHGVVHEEEILWSHEGRACSSRPDARDPDVLIADLKTCRSAQPERFVREATWARHHAQLRFYDMADAADTGRTVYDPRTRKGDRIDLYIVAVETAAPHVCTVFALDDSAIMAADRAIAAWWARLMACEAENAWHGYRQGVEPFTCDDPENFMGGIIDAADSNSDAAGVDEWSNDL